MYVCMCVCMYVCAYVFVVGAGQSGEIDACMYVCIHIHMYTNGLIRGHGYMFALQTQNHCMHCDFMAAFTYTL